MEKKIAMKTEKLIVVAVAMVMIMGLGVGSISHIGVHPNSSFFISHLP